MHNFIPDWLKLANEGKYEEAADLCHQTNSFPEICGRICPQDKLCEGACTLNTGFEAVTIGQIEKHITDTAINMGWKPKRYVEKFGKKHVSIIGAGPAGLACAENLIMIKFSAQASPAGPAPIMDTCFLPNFSTYRFGFHPILIAVSVICFSICPIVTASKPVFRVHAPSHSLSCGQILPHISGNELV